MNGIPWITATEAARRICAGTLTSMELVQACLERITRHNPAINALVTLDREGALAAARLADERVKRGAPMPPLLGIPLSIKDAFETRGLRTTSSHPPLAQHIPQRDGTAVARLKEAGAILLGKTNLPELAGDPGCWSPLFGPTRNPWDLSLTPGGSSGGSAAALAMGFSLLELGSDIAGSIRIPAAYCGVAGFKATENRIPRTGHIPHLPRGQRTVRHMLSFGILGRSVADLHLGFQQIAGPDGMDTEVPPLLPRSLPAPLARPLRVAWWDDFHGLPLCSRTRAGLSRAVERLTAAGLTVKRAKPEGFDFQEAWSLFGMVGGCEIGLGMPALERLFLLGARHLLPQRLQLTRAIASGLDFDLRRYNAALNGREELIQGLEHFLEEWDVWLCPVACTTAYPAKPLGKFRKPPDILVDGRPLPYLEATISMTAPFSLTGSPVVSLPVGPVDGLPVGVQVIGRRWRDEELLGHCLELESVLGGFTPPPETGLRNNY